MGKVYDALKRAEEQRAGRVREPSAVATPSVRAQRPSQRAGGLRSLWKRLFSRRRAQEFDDISSLNKRRVAVLQPHSFVAEQFRSLRSRIDSLAAQRPLRTIAVASAGPGDGKTMAAVNLALVMSMSVGRKVVLVDCDLRRAEVHQPLGLHVEMGLAEVLRGEATIAEALVQADGSSLTVLPVRELPPNPSELLASSRMRELAEKLATDFDCVIFDVPPTLGLPDAKVVTELCDGVIFVVRAGITPREDVEAALDVLGRERIFGLLLNDVEMEPLRYGDPS